MITIEESYQKVKDGALLVDVRTNEEFRANHLNNALHIPYDQVEKRLNEFGADKNQPIVLYCQSGRRSAIAQQILEKNGFSQVFNAPGIEAWDKEMLRK